MIPVWQSGTFCSDVYRVEHRFEHRFERGHDQILSMGHAVCHLPSYIYRLTSYVLRLTSCLLPLTSYLLPVLPYKSFATEKVLEVRVGGDRVTDFE